MAVPTISTLSPTSGPALGRNLVEITGTNFRVPPTPPAGPTDGTRPQTVKVTINGELAPRTDVISATLLRVRFPAYRGDGNQATFPAVSVTVENFDDSDTLIPGETATSAGAYTYTRVNLRPTTEDDNPYSAVTRELLQVYKRSVVKDVFSQPHTDYSETPFIETFIARVPSVHLIGPKADDDLEFTTQEFRDISIGGGVSERYDPPVAHMLEYEVRGISDNKPEHQALMTAVRELHDRLATLEVDAPSPLTGRLEYPLRQTAEPRDVSVANESNLLVFSSTIVVRSVWVFFKEPREKIVEITDILGTVSNMQGANVEIFFEAAYDDGFDEGFA